MPLKGWMLPLVVVTTVIPFAPVDTAGSATAIGEESGERVDAAHAAATPASVVVAAGTELVFEMVETVSSKTHVRGDRFALRLAEAVVVDGQVLAAAGTPAFGEGVHSAKSTMGGQPGELILAARELDLDGTAVPLKSFNASVGQGRQGTSIAVAVAAGVFGMLVRGKHVELPAGSLIGARLRADTRMAILADAGNPPASTPVAPTHHPTIPGESTE